MLVDERWVSSGDAGEESLLSASDGPPAVPPCSGPCGPDLSSLGFLDVCQSRFLLSGCYPTTTARASLPFPVRKPQVMFSRPDSGEAQDSSKPHAHMCRAHSGA